MDQATDLDAFNPPADYTFEPEFLPPVPRPIPRRARQGPMERRRRWAVRLGAVAGIALILLSSTTAIQHWSKFILPLAYLSWAGGGLLMLCALSALLGWLTSGRYRYIRDGIPLIAHVNGLVKAQVGPTPFYAFTALVAFRDPETGELVQRVLRSPEFIGDNKDDYTTSFKVGDFVTAVYLPGKYPKSLQLFGFLELAPGVGVVRRQLLPLRRRLSRTTSLPLIVVGFLAVAAWVIYAARCCWPVEFPWYVILWSALTGGSAAAALFFTVISRHRRCEQQRIAQRNEEALASGGALEIAPASPRRRGVVEAYALKVILLVGYGLMGGAIVLSSLFVANAWLDRSPVVFKEVEVIGMQVMTYNHIFRQHLVKYTLPGVAEPQAFATTPEHAKLLAEQGKAVAEVHYGRFGWPWVESLHLVGPPNF